MAEVEEEEEATVLRKADTRGGWEQCRSMPGSQPASQPADPTLPSLLLFSSLTLYPVFPPRLRRTHPEIKHERLHEPPLHTLPPMSPCRFPLLSSCVSLFLLAVSASQPLSRFIFPSFEALFRLWRTYSY